MMVEAVEDLTRTVGRLPATPTCAEPDRRIRSLCHERIAKLNGYAEEYSARPATALSKSPFSPDHRE